MLCRVPDDDLLSHGNSVLSSACRRFTVLFGMGRGGASGLWSSGVDWFRSQKTEGRGQKRSGLGDGLLNVWREGKVGSS